jgi:hypothetical protein
MGPIRNRDPEAPAVVVEVVIMNPQKPIFASIDNASELAEGLRGGFVPNLSSFSG